MIILFSTPHYFGSAKTIADNLEKMKKSFDKYHNTPIGRAAGKAAGEAAKKAFQASRLASTAKVLKEGLYYTRKGYSLISGMMDNSPNSPTNGELGQLPFLSQSSINPLGRNDAIYHKTHVHVGKKTSSRIKTLASGPFVEKLTKSTSSSLSDYQDHEKRKYLVFKSGFNEKGYAFFLEDTYFSVEDYYKLFKIKERFDQELNDNNDGLKDIYGCVLKNYNQVKIKNRNPNFSCHVKIHLIKIVDIRTNVRSLIQQITHNSEQIENDSKGRIPKDFQYTTPVIYDYDNRFATSFLTNLSCSLSLSTKFREQAKIVRSWSSTLPPSSIWEFNLTTHLGRGIHINTINDLYNDNLSTQLTTVESMMQSLKELKDDKSNTLNIAKKNFELLRAKLDEKFVKSANEHPGSYILVMEYVGDRRATLQRNIDKDAFSGYSPCFLSVEFDTEITLLNNQDNPKEDEFLVYKRIRQDKNFPDDSTFKDIFYPNREIVFHIPSDKIGNRQKPYSILFDEIVGPDTPEVMDMLKDTFASFGLDPNSVTPDDLRNDLNNTNTTDPDTDTDSNLRGSEL